MASSRSQRPDRPSAFRQNTAVLLLLAAPLWVVALRQLLPDLLGAVSFAPDVLSAALAVAAWNHRPLAAVAFAAITGYLLDVPSDLTWGVSSVRCAGLVAFFASLRGSLALELPGTRLLMLGLFVLVERLSAVLALKAMLPAVEIEPLLWRGCWIALVTLPLAPLAFALSGALQAEAGCEVQR